MQPNDQNQEAYKIIRLTRLLSALKAVISRYEYDPKYHPLFEEEAVNRIIPVLHAQKEFRTAIDKMTREEGCVENLWDFRMEGDRLVKHFLYPLRVGNGATG